MTADDLANCSTVGAHRAPLQLNALSSYLRDTTLEFPAYSTEVFQVLTGQGRGSGIRSAANGTTPPFDKKRATGPP
jgi:hypothetical protein